MKKGPASSVGRYRIGTHRENHLERTNMSLRTKGLLLIAAGIVIIMLTGCSSVASVTPTLQHCETVKYSRDGDKIDFTAKCRAPIGGSLPGLPH